MVALLQVALLVLIAPLLGASRAAAAEPLATTLTVTPHLPWWAGGDLRADIVLEAADGTRITSTAIAYVDGVVATGFVGTSDNSIVVFRGPTSEKLRPAGPHEFRLWFRGSAEYLPSEWTGTIEASEPTISTALNVDLPSRVPLADINVPISVTASDGSPIQGELVVSAYTPDRSWGGGYPATELVDGRSDATIWFSAWPSDTAVVTIRFVPDGGLKPAVVTRTVAIGYSMTATAPTISGAARVGGTLTAKAGTWTSGATLDYQWWADGALIAGATAKTFVPRAAQAGRRLTVTVTGSKAGYRTVEKVSLATGPVGAANPQLGYQGHVQNIGWQPWVTGGKSAGTTGRSLRVEALRFRLNKPAYSGGITASAHVQNIGWMAPVTTGGLVGTTGRSLRVEAFTIKLTGEMAKHYDVYYRTHAQNFGWLGWAKNGGQSGTAGYSYRLEAVDVRLVAKGDPGPAGTGLRAFYQR